MIILIIYYFQVNMTSGKGIVLMIEKIEGMREWLWHSLTDFSKVLDYINHPLLVAKMYNYGVSPLSINMIFSYLNNRTHRTKVKECFSERSWIEYGVSQGSIVGPLLFNIDLIDLFYECEESNIASYADDTTLYSCAKDTQTVITELKFVSNKLFHLFQYNT